MEWISNSRILIVGLGLIGGSYARALKRLGYHVTAIDTRKEAIDYAMENCIADFDYYALLRAQDIVGSMGISESTLQYALSMEGYYNDQIDYAVQYCGADWDYEATEVATDYVSDFPDCTHDELYLVLVSNFGFSDYQASQGCANVGK